MTISAAEYRATAGKRAIIKESDIHKTVVAHWRARGLPGTLVATISNMGAMGQYGLTKGLPDLILIGPKVHGYLELKTDTGKLSAPQREFQSLCMDRGIPFFVTHGVDEPIRLLEALEIVRPDHGFISIGEAAASIIDRLREERR